MIVLSSRLDLIPYDRFGFRSWMVGSKGSKGAKNSKNLTGSLTGNLTGMWAILFDQQWRVSVLCNKHK